ncbi:MAG: Na+/H+ antiporter subunit E [Deltaproteobacteria bacterium]|nr:Na+/H+ antiporter subunit E [Deltaproteobacteria bacterium]
MCKLFKVCKFLLLSWIPRYFKSVLGLTSAIILRKSVKPTFVRFTLDSEHDDFSYWFLCVLISFTPGTIGVNYDETHVLVHFFDEKDVDDIINFIYEFIEVLK